MNRQPPSSDRKTHVCHSNHSSVASFGRIQQAVVDVRRRVRDRSRPDHRRRRWQYPSVELKRCYVGQANEGRLPAPFLRRDRE